MQRSTQDYVWAQFLENKNMVINIRKSRGKSINAACGQLALTETPHKQRIRRSIQKDE